MSLRVLACMAFTVASALAQEPRTPDQWTEVDSDGLVALVRTNPRAELQLVRNQGDGTFYDTIAQAGLGGLTGRAACALVRRNELRLECSKL